MQRHEVSRTKERHFDSSEGETDWGQPRSRVGYGKMRRVRHEPYRRQPNHDRRSWLDYDDAD